MNLVDFLVDVTLAAPVAELRPDYRALLIAVEDITPAPSDERSEELLRAAEAHAQARLADAPVTELPHVAAWRAAYDAFGAQPSRTRNSAEALLRRAGDPGTGLPRINRLTDIYNSISVRYEIPVGGENLAAYVSAPRLVRATGAEDFAIVAEGEPVTEHPEPGEVIWRDDAGVTFRAWNYRQCTRTALHDDTTKALFIFDALDPFTDEDLRAAGDELIDELRRFSPDLAVAQRILRP